MKRRNRAATGRKRSTRRGRRRDEGSVFIQFALAMPILMVFALGIVEFGLGWKWANDVNAAARDASRSATSAPAYVFADRTALLSIGSAFTPEQVDNLEKVIVFKASSTNGQVPANCKSLTPSTASTGHPVGRSGSCNVYGKAQINYVLANPGDKTPWVGGDGTAAHPYYCPSNSLAVKWCPINRSHSLATGSFDNLGVYIKVKKPSVTHFGFGEQKIERTAVFRLEPSFGGG